MMPPEKVTTPEFVERLRKTVLRICEERTGNKGDRKNNRLKCESWDVDLMGDGSWICGKGS